MKTPYIPDKRIERAAEQLLASYEAAHGRIFLPVPVEDLLERYLGFALGFCDLKAELGNQSVLGATFRASRRVAVDLSLDPDAYPEQEGRYRFTIAHEIGHWILHEPLSTVEDATIHMAQTTPSESRDRRELQADRFAAALLMPRALVEKQWDQVGSIEPHMGFDPTNEMACRFHVSEHAMWIRLERLGLLQPGTVPPACV